MTLKFFKSVKSAVVLAGIAGVLLFAGGALATPSVTVGTQNGTLTSGTAA